MLRELNERLAFHGPRMVGIARALPGVTGPFGSAEEFRERATTVAKVEMLAYGVDSYRLLDILIPESYAQALNPIREFRLRLERTTSGGPAPVRHAKPLEARRHAYASDFDRLVCFG
jgi:hypothetical protein